MDRGISRRTLLGSALSAPLLAACSGSFEDAPTDSPGVRIADGELTSRHCPGQRVSWVVARPTARPQAPLVVALHGRGGHATNAFTGLHLDRHVAATGLAVAAIDGGDTYWHARRSGVDTGAMVVDDFLPLLASMGLSTARVGLLGWSMGGYGALWLATGLGRARVAGVAASSAALWLSPGDSAPGAFDDREDFVRHDVFRLRSRLRGIPVRLDCGLDDPFLRANRAFASGLPGTTTQFDPGGHTDAFWSAHGGPQMTWLARQLTA
ncbi:alpha/beta hydrolase-fold protein [Oryzihumus sp.]|uniref:alpha/beta hydrolase-fold protein n=1 Tax=Oryzihumus sp. TaxID=1968903 RepID=UPI002EDB7A8E